MASNERGYSEQESDIEGHAFLQAFSSGGHGSGGIPPIMDARASESSALHDLEGQTFGSHDVGRYMELDKPSEKRVQSKEWHDVDNIEQGKEDGTRSLVGCCCRLNEACLLTDLQGWKRVYELIKIGLGLSSSGSGFDGADNSIERRKSDGRKASQNSGGYDSIESSVPSEDRDYKWGHWCCTGLKFRIFIATVAIGLQVLSAYTGFKAGIQSGPVLETLSEQQYHQFSKEILIMAVLYLVNSFSLILSAFIGERLRIEWRHVVLTKIHDLYFGSAVPYWLNGGAVGIKNRNHHDSDRDVRANLDTVDQRITQDLDSFTQYCSQLLFGLFDDPYSASSTLVSLVLSATFVSNLGWFPIMLSVSFFAVAVLIVTLLTPRVSQATKRAAKAMGDLRFALARVLEHAESVLFWKGQKFELERLDRLLHVTYIKYISLYIWQFLLSSWTSFQGSFPEVLGLIATAVLCWHFNSGVHSISDIAQSVASIRALTAAMCFLPSVLSKAGLIFGYAHRVGALVDILRSRLRETPPSQTSEPRIKGHSGSTLCSHPEGTTSEAATVSTESLVSVSGLSLVIGSEEETVLRIGPVNFTVERYRHTLIEGPSGCGKSTLLRAIAGLVPSAANCIRFSTDARRENHVFLSQRVYLPSHLSLRDLILYPHRQKSEPSVSTKPEGTVTSGRSTTPLLEELPRSNNSIAHTDVETPTDMEMLYLLYALGFKRLLSSLGECSHSCDSNMSDYVPRWAPLSLWSYIEETCEMSFAEFRQYFGERDVGAFLDGRRSWNTILSVGEQQRLLLARLLWQRPTVAFLDESTSAMNDAMEVHCIELLKRAGITLVSVGHSRTLRAFHKQLLKMTPIEESSREMFVRCRVSQLSQEEEPSGTGNILSTKTADMASPEHTGGLGHESIASSKHKYSAFGIEFWRRLCPLLTVLLRREKIRTLITLMLAVGINVTLAFVTVKNAVLPGQIFESINEGNWESTWKLITLATIIYFVAAVLGAAARSVGSAITIMWYRKLVGNVNQKLLEGNAAIEATAPRSDVTETLSVDDMRSLDQRVIADTFEMTHTVGTILFGARGRISLLQVFFTCITLSVKASQYGWLPLVLCMTYTLVTSAVVAWLVLPIAHWVYTRNTWEGRFRTVHTTIREYSEQIAFYFGEKREYYAAENTFRSLKRVYLRLINAEFWPVLVDKVAALSGTTAAYGFLAVGLIVTSQLGSHAANAGTITSAVGVLISLNLYLGSLPDYLTHVAETSGLVYRVSELIQRLDQRGSRDDHAILKPTDSKLVDATDLACRTPQGQEILRNINFSVEEGEPLWIQGSTGCGKSSLLRLLAGIWKCDRGKISWHPKLSESSRIQVVFVPQRPYTFSGSLRENILYPDHYVLGSRRRQHCGEVLIDMGTMGPSDLTDWPAHSKPFSEERLRTVLHHVMLDTYCHRMDEVADWPTQLSLGEQQRLAFARVLLQQPVLVFLDEATSALDTVAEQQCMKSLSMANISYVSIGHRNSLKSFHTKVFRPDE
eukprot:gb/GECG01007993.1/.p1 GENE.gb/GECG01007993.1/~~gb/GECG01007993.1/.p1  ORF type:complete len:1513 (+),score=160.09 gb/GECG01007993.1/:1-4539(+)